MRGALRVNGPGRTDRDGLRIAAEEPPGGTYDKYLARLIKLIPAEVVALYLVGYGLIPSEHPYAALGWTVLGVLAVVVVRATATRDEAGRPQWLAVGAAVGSFVIWVYSLGHVFDAFGIYVPFVGSLLVLAWTFFLPYIYKGS
jgi:apolipoprotein N-acyltransferase